MRTGATRCSSQPLGGRAALLSRCRGVSSPSHSLCVPLPPFTECRRLQGDGGADGLPGREQGRRADLLRVLAADREAGGQTGGFRLLSAPRGASVNSIKTSLGGLPPHVLLFHSTMN